MEFEEYLLQESTQIAQNEIASVIRSMPQNIRNTILARGGNAAF